MWFVLVFVLYALCFVHFWLQIVSEGAIMGALVFSLPQRFNQRRFMPEFCFVHSAKEAALKIMLLESRPELLEQLRTEARENVERYALAPTWSFLEMLIRHSDAGC